jgi:hypothetical protein
MVQVQQQREEPYQYMQSEIDRINKREEENKRRAQLQEIIPIERFVDSKTGHLDEAKFQNELEKRVHSNMSVEDIAELYGYIESNRVYNDSNYAAKTASASFNSNTNSNDIWFLDVFDSLQQQRRKQRY